MPSKKQDMPLSPLTITVFIIICLVMIGILFYGVKYSFDKVGYAADSSRPSNFDSDLNLGNNLGNESCYESCENECHEGCYNNYFFKRWCFNRCVSSWCAEVCG